MSIAVFAQGAAALPLCTWVAKRLRSHMAMDEQCPVCKDAFGSTPDQPVSALTCGHRMHDECMRAFCQVKQQDPANTKCPICSLTSHDVHALEVSQGIGPATTTTVDGSKEVDGGDEDEASTDVEALTEALPAPEAVPAPKAVPPPEAVPQPETALAQVIIITTIVYVPTRVHDYY